MVSVFEIATFESDLSESVSTVRWYASVRKGYQVMYCSLSMRGKSARMRRSRLGNNDNSHWANSTDGSLVTTLRQARRA